jgi:hypothetical protein
MTIRATIIRITITITERSRAATALARAGCWAGRGRSALGRRLKDAYVGIENQRRAGCLRSHQNGIRS